MRRLGIFLFYDGAGRVSPHVHTSIKAFSPHCDDIIFVANGALDMESYEGLEDYVTHLLQRENIGFDVWGYKAGIEHVGYDNLGDYDEIVLLNYTFFAPVGDIATMFERMEQRDDLDAWGMTEYSDAGKSFLQSYFLCSRKSLHTGEDYRDYWQTMPMIQSINDSLDYHEFRFSRHFRELGYKLEPYVKNRDGWDGNTTLTDVDGLLDDGMPIIKYRSFNFDPDIIEARGGRKVSENFELVQNRTDFPVAEIWDYIINQTPPDDLIIAADLCRVVSVEPGSEMLDGVQVIATLEDPSTLELAFARLERIPSERVIVATQDDDIRTAALARGYQVLDTDVLHIALRSARAHLSAAAQVGQAIAHLSDFAQERERYFFKESLFRNYWDPLLCPEAVSWLTGQDHIGMVFAFPDAVNGISSFRSGTGTSLGNWKKGFRPGHLRRAARQINWPWRGNMLIKAGVAADDLFQKEIDDLLENVVIRDRESLAGPEGALPELLREMGFASGIVVPQAETGKLLLRSALRAKASAHKVSELAQKLRTYQKKTQAAATPAAKSASVTEPVTFSDRTKRLTRHGLPGYRHCLLHADNRQARFNETLKLRYTFESLVVSENRIETTGWAFDMQNPHDFIELGIVKGDRFIHGPEQLRESRPDVLDAFSDQPLVERSGFDLSLPNIETSNLSDYQIVFMNRAKQTACVMPLTRSKRKYRKVWGR